MNWTGQAIACPRSRFAALAEWPESARPGVYFLISGSEGDERGKVYIGESEDVRGRLVSHEKKKDFWSEVVIFTSKDENLTKSHVKYLESKLVSICKKANRADLDNGNEPSLTKLPRADADAMDEFIDQLRVVLRTLGHRFTEPLAAAPIATPESPGGHTGNPVLNVELAFSFKGLEAKGMMTDEGFLVLQGSQVVADHAESTPDTIKRGREKAIADGTLSVVGDHRELSADKLFTSSSWAASFVSGSSRNGRDCWRAADGRSLKDLEDAAAPERLLGEDADT